MAASPALLLRHLGRLAGRPTPDAALLDRFLHDRDERAFAALVRRHGPMVFRVCRRVLADPHAADDAFQATFLVLARRARTVRRRTSLAAWLHGVARRVALKARTARARRHRRETPGEDPACADPRPGPLAELTARETLLLLDEELARLPEGQRLPIVLCCLEGLTLDEAAERLGCTRDSVRGRLERGRKRLHERLARRGLTLAAALAVAEVWRGAGLAEEMVGPTVRAALAYAAGQRAGAAGLRAAVTALAEKATPGLSARFAVGAAVMLALALTAAAVVRRDAPASPPDKEAPPPPAVAANKADAPADPLAAGAVLRLGATRLRHGTAVNRLVLSPDGTKVAAFGGGSLSLWDTKTGDRLRQVDLQGTEIASVAWLADGRGIAILQAFDGREMGEKSHDGESQVWEFTNEKVAPKFPPRRGFLTGKPRARPPGDNEVDCCYAVSPDGKTLAAGRDGHLDRERAITLRPLKTGVAVGELPEPKELARQAGNCKLLLFTPDGKRLVAFRQAKEGDEATVVVWDLAAGKETARFKASLPPETPGVRGHRPAAVSDTTLALGVADGGASLWDLATGKKRALDTDHVAKERSKYAGTNVEWQFTGTVAVAFAPDGKTLATAGRDGVVKLWDVTSCRYLRSLERHYSWPEALAWSRDGRIVVSASRDGVIRLWDAATGKDICPQPGHHQGVFRAVLSPDGKTAVTASWDHTVRWWDTATGRELRVVPGAVNDVAVSPDGRTVFASGDDKRLRTWDLATGRETTPAVLPDGLRAGLLAFTPDGRRLVTASGPRVTVLDWPGMKVRHSFDVPKPDKQTVESECQELAVSPDGRRLVTVAERSGWRRENGPRDGASVVGVVDVWDLGTGRRVCRLAEWKDIMRSLTAATFTADGRVVLTPGKGTVPAQGGRPEQSFEGEVALLDPETPRWLRSFTSSGRQYTMATVVSPDGRTLYVSFDTCEVVAFEVATGQPRRNLYGHGGFVGSLAMTPDGRRLIAGCNDASAYLWDATPAGAAKPRKEPLTAAGADELWAALAGLEAQPAYAAMADMGAAPDRAVVLVRRELKPVPVLPTDAELDRAFADLDSEDFATREKASRRLAEWGELAVPGVRKRLDKTESAEVRRRALDFLSQFDPATLKPDRLRQLRAVELLEGIGTPAARDLLSELAKGAAEAPLTRDATAALERLRRR
jgi:RNA polymerase sigma factor (sigma-70 family)